MASLVAANGLLALALVAVPFVFGEFAAYQLGLFLIYGMVCQGIGLAWGRGGFLPLGQALFFGLAAYLGGGAMKIWSGSFWLIPALLLTVAAIAALAYVTAWLVFRQRRDSGPYFSLITLALVMLAEQLAGSLVELSGGFNGLGGIEAPFGLDPFGNFYWVIGIATLAVTFTLLLIDRMPAGLLARGVADNEPRLQALGFASHRIKASLYAGSAAIAALAGVLFAAQQGIVTPVSIGFALSAELVIFTAVGGRFHVLGPLLGAVLIGYASAELRDRLPYWELLMAALFMLVVLKAPSGLIGVFEAVLRPLLDGLKALLPSRVVALEKRQSAPPSRASGSPASLKFASVGSRIGSVRILQDLSVEMPAQGVVCLIGPNGAGKTSLINASTGLLPVQEGQMMLGEQRLNGLSANELLSRGVARKFQIPSVFASLSVEQNLQLSVLAGRMRWRDYLRRSALQWQGPLLNDLLSVPGVPLTADTMKMPAAQLPQGHRQILELMMASAAEPRVLCLDEPCAGLSPAETQLVVQLIQDIADRLHAMVLVVEHDMNLVDALADHVIVLHQGRVLAQGSLAEMRDNAQVNAVYAGGHK